MKDLTLNGFIVACVGAGIAYFLTKTCSGLESYLISFLLALAGYFAYLGIKKSSDQSKWESGEVSSGFLASAFAQWVPVVLGFVLGFPPGNG